MTTKQALMLLEVAAATSQVMNRCLSVACGKGFPPMGYRCSGEDGAEARIQAAEVLAEWADALRKGD